MCIMKKILTIFAILGMTFCGYTQEPDSIPMPKIKTAFAEIRGIKSGIIGNKITVEIDFGEENFFWGNDGRNRVVDENGKPMKFNTMIDAMNFMGERGWVYTDSYVVTIGNQNIIHWLLSKELEFDKNARGDIKQKRDFKKPKKKKKKPVQDPNDHDDIYH